MKTQFPFDGEYFRSPKKKYEEIIFFVHFFEGNKRLLKRHIRTVNILGFDAFAFTLPLHWNFSMPPVSASLDIGWKHYYADVVEELLNLVPGKKIVFSFSNPSASAIEAMARRNCVDTVALICDSGPSAHFLKSVINLGKQYFLEGQLKKAALVTTFSPVFWSLKMHKDINAHLNHFPNEFPVLSIRGERDPLISPKDIDEVFKRHHQLDFKKISLPNAGHLNGLRDFRQDYLPGLILFLEKFVKTST